MQSAHVVLVLIDTRIDTGMVGAIRDAHIDVVIGADEIAFAIEAFFGVPVVVLSELADAMMDVPPNLLNALA